MDPRTPPDAAPDDDPGAVDASLEVEGAPARTPSVDALVRGLPIAGISRRRVAFLVATVVTAWVLIVFARQVSEASAASDRADLAAVENGQLSQQVAALQHELDMVQTSQFIDQQARAYGLGARGEVPFRLAPGAPPLPSDAPGSAALRLGEAATPRSPLESWLTVLFGSGH